MIVILRKKSNFRPQKFVTYYERGMISAIEIGLPAKDHLGCHFHFSKAIYTKVQDVGLARQNARYPDLNHAIRMLMATAYLPPAEVCPKVAEFCAKNSTKNLVSEFPAFAEILRYFYRTWIVAFPMSMWNVFERPEKIRTTNVCEGWNNAWSRKNLQRKPNFRGSLRYLKRALSFIFASRTTSRVCP